MSQGYRIGVDVGGTFTDVVVMATDGAITIAKVATTPDDQSGGVMQGLDEAAARMGMTSRALLAATGQIVHGTTVATNALLERKGVRVGLLTTLGHRDILEMREGLKPDRYNLLLPPPEPLVPRHLRRGVRERMAHDGRVLIALDEYSLREEILVLANEGVESVAVGYLHAYRNPAHELRTRELLAEYLPDAYVSLSSDVLPQIKEYERISTTVVNSYVGPVVRNYLDKLERRLRTQGLAGDIYIILSHGGIAPVAEAVRLASATVLSGPAGGIAGARQCASMLGLEHALPFDMGGTSTEISLIAEGRLALTSERGVAGERIALRSFDILSIGAGGGSIAGRDPGGAFTVGPRSAGAWPGPACYGRGGTRPTVTDANLILGYLDADRFRGGQGGLDADAASTSVGNLAGQLGLDTVETAQGIHRLINVKMADGMRLMTLRRGVDPRHFTVIAFGGAAGIHALEVARELGVRRVIIPDMASVLSAWGMLNSDLRYELSQTRVTAIEAMDQTRLRALFAALESEAHARCGFAGDASLDTRVERFAEMRYGDQIYEVDVSLDGLDLDHPNAPAELEERFHRRHEALFTYAARGQLVEIVNIRVGVIAAMSHPQPAATQPDPNPPGPAHRIKRVRLRGNWQEVPVYWQDDLSPGHHFAGPAMVEAENTTVVLHAGDKATVNSFGWLDIAVCPGVSGKD